jgi:hypothetical protein
VHWSSLKIIHQNGGIIMLNLLKGIFFIIRFAVLIYGLFMFGKAVARQEMRDTGVLGKRTAIMTVACSAILVSVIVSVIGKMTGFYLLSQSHIGYLCALGVFPFAFITFITIIEDFIDNR